MPLLAPRDIVYPPRETIPGGINKFIPRMDYTGIDYKVSTLKLKLDLYKTQPVNAKHYAVSMFSSRMLHQTFEICLIISLGMQTTV